MRSAEKAASSERAKRMLDIQEETESARKRLADHINGGGEQELERGDGSRGLGVVDMRAGVWDSNHFIKQCFQRSI